MLSYAVIVAVTSEPCKSSLCGPVYLTFSIAYRIMPQLSVQEFPYMRMVQASGLPFLRLEQYSSRLMQIFVLGKDAGLSFTWTSCEDTMCPSGKVSGNN